MHLIAAVLLLASLDGLWASRRDFGPDVRGTLRISGDLAEIAGRSATIAIKGGEGVEF